MNSLAKKARWAGSLMVAGVLLVTGAGAAAADQAPEVPGATAVGWRSLGLAVSPDGTRAYVVAWDRVGSDLSVVLRTVDTRTGTVVARLALADTGTAGRPVVSPDGSRLYVVVSEQLVAVSTATNTVLSRTPAPDQPRPAGWSQGRLTGLAVSRDGARVYVDQYGPYGLNQGVGTGRVLVFSTGQDAFTSTVPVGGYQVDSIAVAPNGGAAYVSTDQGLFHLDTGGAVPAVARVVDRLGASTELAPSPDGTRLYALGWQTGSGTGYEVDTARDTARPAVTFGSGWVDVHFVSVSPDGRRLYVLKDGWAPKASVLSFDTATNTGVPAETLTGFALDGVSDAAVGPDGHTLYVVGLHGGDGSYLKTVGF
ncbi:YncE family protein [Kitasatospora sp. NPDC088351]|uniref:YncE family protein n=1 Tax=Kitasatospora sp. NPDC088351 TaxID=3155180 RepID=UPI0034383344